MCDPPAMYRLEHAEQERQVLSSELLPQLIAWLEDSTSLVLRPGEREEMQEDQGVLATNLRLLALHSRLLGPLLGSSGQEAGLVLPFTGPVLSLLLQLLETGTASSCSLRHLETVLEAADCLGIRLENLDFSGMYTGEVDGSAMEDTVSETVALSETTLKEEVATFPQLAAENEPFKTGMVETKPDNSLTSKRVKANPSIEEHLDYTVSNVSINYNLKRESLRYERYKQLKLKPHSKQKNKSKKEFKMKRKEATHTVDTKAVKGSSIIPVKSSLEEEDAVQKLLSHMGREADRVSGRLQGRGVTLQNSLRAGLITISVNKEGDTTREDEKYFETHCAVTKKITNCTRYKGHCNCVKCKLASNKSISTRLENEKHGNISVWPNRVRNSTITVVKDPFNSKRSLAVQNLTRNMKTNSQNGKVLNRRKIHCRKCPEVFDDHLARKQHMAIHYKLACTVCGKPFKELNSLKLHMRIHAPERPFSCDICGKGFNQKGNLYTHKEKNHNKMSNCFQVSK